jgi:hypothetical protein
MPRVTETFTSGFYLSSYVLVRAECLEAGMPADSFLLYQGLFPKECIPHLTILVRKSQL